MINRRDFCKGLFGAGAVLGYPFAGFSSDTPGEEGTGEVLRSIADVLSDPGEVFSYQKEQLLAMLIQPGRIVAGTGFSSGKAAAGQAGHNACNSALFDKQYLKEAVSIAVILTGGQDLMLYEILDAMEPLWYYGADRSKEIHWQHVIKDNMTGKRRVTVIACVT